ncbi:MAG: hypothetical protein QF384_10860, partial [Alphaproteobacteria bacterium]|nr:hypothetical protein [Alphaproteobacteria bacterium]
SATVPISALKSGMSPAIKGSPTLRNLTAVFGCAAQQTVPVGRRQGCNIFRGMKCAVNLDLPVRGSFI